MQTSFTKQLVQKIKETDFSADRVTVFGFGGMGKNYVAALQTLGVKEIRVCSQSKEKLLPLKGLKNVTTFSGGFESFFETPHKNELAIIAVPVDRLIPAALHLKKLGYQKFLIEKPISLYSKTLETFTADFSQPDYEAFCAYNRVAYPTVLEAKAMIREEGGPTSCHMTLTEMVRADWPERFPAEELARWGVSNSSHVISLASAFIGFPEKLSTFQSGNAFHWHPSGSVFTGAGVSDKRIPFSAHADWGSKGRWAVEVTTRKAAYRFCPLEKLYRKAESLGEWQEIPVYSVASEIKAGFVEQVSAALHSDLRQQIPLVSLLDAAKITQFAERLFGYSPGVHHV